MQNNKLSDVKSKELVAAGHAFAKAMGMDTPLIEIAKMVSELAGRLDVALVRGDELQQKLGAAEEEAEAYKAFAEQDYFGNLVIHARARASKAMSKFPQPNYVLTKVAEESGELVKAGVHFAEGRETWGAVEQEAIDTIAMIIRLMTEGDEVIGLFPPQLRAGKDGE